MLRSWLLGIVSLVAVMPAGCKKKEQSATPAVDAGSPRALAKKVPPARRQLSPIAVEEVAGFVPAPDGARVLMAPQKARVGERIEVAYCFDSGEPAALAEALKAKLQAAGWMNLNARSHPSVPNRVNLAGQRQPYVVFGSFQRGAFAECTEGAGQTHLSLNVYKQVPAPAGSTATGLVGPAGPRMMSPRALGGMRGLVPKPGPGAAQPGVGP